MANYIDEFDRIVTTTKRNQVFYGRTESKKLASSFTEVASDVVSLYEGLSKIKDGVDVLASGFLMASGIYSLPSGVYINMYDNQLYINDYQSIIDELRAKLQKVFTDYNDGEFNDPKEKCIGVDIRLNEVYESVDLNSVLSGIFNEGGMSSILHPERVSSTLQLPYLHFFDDPFVRYEQTRTVADPDRFFQEALTGNPLSAWIEYSNPQTEVINVSHSCEPGEIKRTYNLKLEYFHETEDIRLSVITNQGIPVGDPEAIQDLYALLIREDYLDAESFNTIKIDATPWSEAGAYCSEVRFRPRDQRHINRLVKLLSEFSSNVPYNSSPGEAISQKVELTDEQVLEAFGDHVPKNRAAVKANLRGFVEGYQEDLPSLIVKLHNAPAEVIDEELTTFFKDVAPLLRREGTSLLFSGFDSPFANRSDGNLFYCENRQVEDLFAFYEDALKGNPVTAWIKHSRTTREHWEHRNCGPRMILHDPNLQDDTAYKENLRRAHPGIEIYDDFSDLPERYWRITLTYDHETEKAGLAFHTHPGDENGITEAANSLARVGFIFDKPLTSMVSEQTPIQSQVGETPELRIRHQHDLDTLVGCMAKLTYKEKVERPDLQKTLSEYFRDDDVAFVLKELLDYEYSDLKRTGISKNLVFYLTDISGNRKIVKFVPNRTEAFKENFVNYHFGKHPILQHFVPNGEWEAPKETSLETPEGDKYYLSIQEDIHGRNGQVRKDIARLEAMYKSKNPRLIEAYLHEMIDNLAVVHHHGTELMIEKGPLLRAQLGIPEDEDHRYSPEANRILKEKRVAAMRRSNYDGVLVEEILSRRTEYGLTWLNGETKKDNRIGPIYIDFGNSGFGNHLVDIMRAYMDEVIMETFDTSGAREGLIERLLGTYHTRRNRLSGMDPEDVDGFISYDMLAIRDILIGNNTTQPTWYDQNGQGDIRQEYNAAAKNELARVYGQMIRVDLGDVIVYKPHNLSSLN